MIDDLIIDCGINPLHSSIQFRCIDAPIDASMIQC